MLPLDAGSGIVEAQASSPRMVPEHLSDMAIARAIVHDVRAVPGVVDMGQGLFAKAATYGPGEHVVGIVLHHPAPNALVVEVHVVIEEASLNTTFADVSRSTASTSSSAGTTPILLRVTDQVRAVVTQTLEHLGLPAPTLVDVTIDDIR
jgi:hypothetical protein